MLAMVILGLMAYTYKTLLGSFVLRRYRYSVESSEMVADDIIKLPCGRTISGLRIHRASLYTCVFLT